MSKATQPLAGRAGTTVQDEPGLSSRGYSVFRHLIRHVTSRIMDGPAEPEASHSRPRETASFQLFLFISYYHSDAEEPLAGRDFSFEEWIPLSKCGCSGLGGSCQAALAAHGPWSPAGFSVLLLGPQLDNSRVIKVTTAGTCDFPLTDYLTLALPHCGDQGQGLMHYAYNGRS